MIRELDYHKCRGLNESIEVKSLDDVGPGGAHHEYIIEGIKGPLDHHPIKPCEIRFQNGPINEVGANGITIESLIAVCMDRLVCFQAGPFACEENARALEGLEEAMEWLRRRTEKRIARGVEGTNEK